MKESEITIIAPGRDTTIWITPQKLRSIALLMEKREERSQGNFGFYTIGNKLTGRVTFQYRG